MRLKKKSYDICLLRFENVSEIKEESRCILFKILLFEKEKNATLTADKICNIYEHDAVLRVAQRCIWFERFRSGNFDLDVKIKISVTGKIDKIVGNRGYR